MKSKIMILNIDYRMVEIGSNEIAKKGSAKMTEQQLQIIKRLSEKYKISAESLDKTLLFLGVGYELNEEQIEQYLSLGEGKLLEKHMLLLFLVLDIKKSDVDNDEDVDGTIDYLEGFSTDQLRSVLQVYFTANKNGKKTYERLSYYILNSMDLSAAQLEQLRLAVKAGMPEKDLLKLAKSGRKPMEISKCVEFYEMMNTKKPQHKKRIFGFKK